MRTRGATPKPSAASRWRWAGSATRPTATACWSRRVEPRRQLWSRCCRWCRGAHRRLAGPDAPFARNPPTAPSNSWSASWHCTPKRIGIRRISLNFAMFRSAFEQGAQLGAGPVARLWRGLPGVLLAVVAAGDAVPLEHEVSARLGAALRLLRGRAADSPGGRRLGDRRGLPRVAVHRRNEQHTGHHPAVPPSAGGDRAACIADGSAPDVSGCRHRFGADWTRRPPDCRNRCGCGMSKLKMLQRQRH